MGREWVWGVSCSSLLLLLLLLVLLLATTTTINLSVLVLGGAVGLVLTGTVRAEEVPRVIDWSVITNSTFKGRSLIWRILGGY